MDNGRKKAVEPLERWRRWPRWKRTVVLVMLLAAGSLLWVLLVDWSPYGHGGGRLSPDDTLVTTSTSAIRSE